MSRRRGLRADLPEFVQVRPKAPGISDMSAVDGKGNPRNRFRRRRGPPRAWLQFWAWFAIVYILALVVMLVFRFDLGVAFGLLLPLGCTLTLPLFIVMMIATKGWISSMLGLLGIVLVTLFWTQPGFRIGQHSLLFFHESSLTAEVQRIKAGQAPRHEVGGLHPSWPDEQGRIAFLLDGLIIGPDQFLIHAPREGPDADRYHYVHHLRGAWYFCY